MGRDPGSTAGKAAVEAEMGERNRAEASCAVRVGDMDLSFPSVIEKPEGPVGSSPGAGHGGSGSDRLLIAVSSSGPELTSPVDPRFGRCPCFVIFDDTAWQGSVFTNCSREASHGAGIQAAQRLIDRGVKMVLSGRVGPQAQEVLDRAGIRIVTGVTGTIEQALMTACESYSQTIPLMTMST